MKKQRNWLGWGLSFFNILAPAVIYLLAFRAYSVYRQDIGYIFNFISIIWFCADIVIIPIILRKTWLRILPEKKELATLIFKHEEGRHAYFSNGTKSTTIKCFFTFELLNGTRKVFNVKSKQFNSFFENESGILVYKEQGKHIYFVNFERQQ